jgi:hypothetical protein
MDKKVGMAFPGILSIVPPSYLGFFFVEYKPGGREVEQSRVIQWTIHSD